MSREGWLGDERADERSGDWESASRRRTCVLVVDEDGYSTPAPDLKALRLLVARPWLGLVGGGLDHVPASMCMLALASTVVTQARCKG